MSTAAVSSVFVSYRRKDSGDAGRLADRLVDRFGAEACVTVPPPVLLGAPKGLSDRHTGRQLGIITTSLSRKTQVGTVL
jgi:hypothetical protein